MFFVFIPCHALCFKPPKGSNQVYLVLCCSLRAWHGAQLVEDQRRCRWCNIDVDLEPDIDKDGDDGDGDDVDVELELDVGVNTNVDIDTIRSWL